MLRSIIFILVVFCTVSACKKETTTRQIPVNIAPDTIIIPIPLAPLDTNALKPKYYLALGDSYTIGQSVNVFESFPAQTVNTLKALNVNFNSPEIIAQTGWTTKSLINNLASYPPLRNNYDIVSLLIGVNNQYRMESQAQYLVEFNILLNNAIALANNKANRVFVLSIPDYSVTPFGISSINFNLISQQIDSFNVINQRETLLAGAQYLNITESTRQAIYDRSLIAEDGLHPSGKEYKKWADLLAKMIKATL